jgi:hypothetical protein
MGQHDQALGLGHRSSGKISFDFLLIIRQYLQLSGIIKILGKFTGQEHSLQLVCSCEATFLGITGCE